MFRADNRIYQNHIIINAKKQTKKNSRSFACLPFIRIRGAPVEGSEQHADDMERVRNQVKRAMIELDGVIAEIYK